MHAKTTPLGHAAVVVGSVFVASTLLAGVVGGMFRLAFTGTMAHGAMPHYDAAGSGFEMGFGVPLHEVLVGTFALALVGGHLYLVYVLASASRSDVVPSESRLDAAYPDTPPEKSRADPADRKR
jgi:hypothetical protein